MTDEPLEDTADPDAIADQRDEVVSLVEDHASAIASALHTIRGNEYGRFRFGPENDDDGWTVKHDEGSLEYLRHEGTGTYVVSTKSPPDPQALVTAMEHYETLIERFNDWVDGLETDLESVAADLDDPPTLTDPSSLVDQRDDVLDAIETAAEAIADSVREVTGDDYGTFSVDVDGTTWELKYDDSGDVSYLRVGGRGGTYLVSQYEPPSPDTLATYLPDFESFVDAYNEWAAEEGDALPTISVTVNAPAPAGGDQS